MFYLCFLNLLHNNTYILSQISIEDSSNVSLFTSANSKFYSFSISNGNLTNFWLYIPNYFKHANFEICAGIWSKLLELMYKLVSLSNSQILIGNYSKLFYDKSNIVNSRKFVIYFGTAFNLLLFKQRIFKCLSPHIYNGIDYKPI